MRRRSRKIYAFCLLVRPPDHPLGGVSVLSYQLLFANCQLLPFRSPDSWHFNYPIANYPIPKYAPGGLVILSGVGAHATAQSKDLCILPSRPTTRSPAWWSFGVVLPIAIRQLPVAAFPITRSRRSRRFLAPSRVPSTRKTKHLVWDIPSVPISQTSLS